MKSRFTNVSFEYTGGGVYVFTALYNGEVWFTTDFLCSDNYGCYDIHPSKIEEEVTPEGLINYDGHWKDPSCQLPTWCEVIMAIEESFGKDQANFARWRLEQFGIGINWIVGRKPTPEEEANERRLMILAEFMDVTLDYLEEHGIPHDHEDLCCHLSGNLEELLTRYGVLKGE